MNKTPYEPSLMLSSPHTESTREKIGALIDGTLDLDNTTMGEYMQLCFLAAMNNDILHVEQPFVYGGQWFNVHMCMSKVGPSPSLDDALSGTQ
jgi:hypothetical protein